METRDQISRHFAEPDIVRLWVIGGTNNVVRWLELLASALFTFELTHSGLMVAGVTAARTLPMLMFGAFAGVVSEAVDRKRIMQFGMMVTATTSAVICGLALAGLARPWHIALSNFICGTVWSAEMSSRRRMVGDRAAPGQLSRVIAIDSLAGASTRMIGPLLGGIVYDLVGLPGAYAIARFKRTGIALAILTARIAPGIGYLIPWFILFTKAKMIDTYAALILTHLIVALRKSVKRPRYSV